MNNRYLLLMGAWILFACTGGAPVEAVTGLDGAFGLGGRVAVELGVKNSAHAVVVQPDGKIVVAGSSSRKNALNFSLLRFNKDGSLDPTFNGDGSVITSVTPGDDEVLALGLLSDGRIVAAGYSHNGTDRDFTLVCYHQDGRLDRTFGSEGMVVTAIGNRNEEITAITVNSEDMITVAGAAEGTVGRALVTARYFADGESDSSYGEQGVSLVGIGEDSSAEGIIERADGSLVISGSYKEKQVASLMLVGLNDDGFLQRGFGDKGVAVPSDSVAASEGYGLAEGGDGRLYLAGSMGQAGLRDTALFCFTQDGRVDPTFGDQGVVVTRVSGEDDVLYAVTASQNGLVASGFTTEAGIRRFLLLSFADLGATAGAATTKDAEKGTLGKGAKLAPVQDVWVNGQTRVLIRRLQVSSSFSDFTTARHEPSFPSFTLGRLPVQAASALDRQDDSYFFVEKRISAAIKRFGDFLLPSAVAADSSTVTSTSSPAAAHVITTSFSEGESVSYASALDAAGNVIVVGTAEGLEASSIVVAQYAAEKPSAESTIVDQPGYRSSFITTTAPTSTTRSTTISGGAILPAFSKTVIKRGVVFSTNPSPAYSGRSMAANQGGSVSDSRIKEAEALKLFKTATPIAGSPDVAANPDALLLAADFVEDGETGNGSGYGTFSALAEKLKPGTVYYVRAYALTAEATVYYGNQLSFRTADACFIATASFGTLLHPGVKILRDFRDTFCVNTALGREVVDWYYTFSPVVADCIAGNELFRYIIRLLLLPVIGFSWLALQVGMVLALLTFMGAAMLLGWFSFRVNLRR